jgi:hypothetical protein
LQDLQPVEIHAGTRRHALHVLAVEGDSVVLGGAGADTVAVGRSDVSLVFPSGGGIVALAGTVSPGPMKSTVRFTVADSAHIPQARASSRLALELDATVAIDGAADTPPTAARVIDVAAGGLGLRGFTAPVGTLVNVSVELPGQGRLLQMRARVARTRPDGCGLAFEPDAHDVAAAIDGFVIACRAVLLARRQAS